MRQTATRTSGVDPSVGQSVDPGVDGRLTREVDSTMVRLATTGLLSWLALSCLHTEVFGQTEASASAPSQEQAEETSVDDRPAREIIPFPVVISDPTNGFGGGGGVLTLYRLNKTDPHDSQTALVGYYTTESSWRLAARQVFSFGEDRYRSTTTAVFGNTNNRFDYADRERDIVFGEPKNTVETDFTVDVYRGIYVGLNYLYGNTDFSFNRGTPEEQEFSKMVLGAAGAEKTIDSGLGTVVFFDNRNHEYSPTGGVFASAKFLNFRKWLGSDNDYRSVDTFLNAYQQVASGHLLAFRFRWRAAYGNVPFSGQSSFGGIDLRAYPTGKYRGTGMFAAQVEYRFPIWKRLRGVAFGGSGRVYGEELTLGANEALPSGGGGIRFLLLQDRGVLVGLDYARGRFGNNGVYFFFGEAF